MSLVTSISFLFLKKIKGFSNGGYMAYRLACNTSDIFAAAASVAGINYSKKITISYISLGTLSECSPKVNIPILSFHGTADTLVRYNSDVEFFDTRLAAASCSDNGTITYTNGNTTCVSYTDCDSLKGFISGVANYTFCATIGGNHGWPGNKIYSFLVLIKIQEILLNFLN